MYIVLLGSVMQGTRCCHSEEVCVYVCSFYDMTKEQHVILIQYIVYTKVYSYLHSYKVYRYSCIFHLTSLIHELIESYNKKFTGYRESSQGVSLFKKQLNIKQA